MRAEHIAVIGPIQHDGVLGCTGLFESVKHAAHLTVDSGHLSVIDLQGPAQTCFIRAACLLRRGQAECSRIIEVEKFLRTLLGFVGWTITEIEAPGLVF